MHAAVRLILLFAIAWSQVWTEAGATTSVENPCVADFFVSSRGNDQWSGKLAEPGDNDGPFASILRAREAVREQLKTHKEPRHIRVELRSGTYYLDSPLDFGPEDSGTERAPVVYAAAAGER